MKKIVILLLSFSIILCGCSTLTLPHYSPNQQTHSAPNTNPDTLTNETDYYPSLDEVEAARDKYLKDLSPETINVLGTWIAAQNLSMEVTFINDKFAQFNDPDSLMWNIYEDTGDKVLIGYAYDESEKEKNHPEMDGSEYAKLYGEPVVTQNHLDADSYIKILKDYQSIIYDDDFSKIFSQLIHYYSLLKETHDVEYLLKIYYTYHDMDYYLFRYAPDTFKDENIIDKSTIYKYYGTLGK
ncbi:hypothetical protein SAMN04487831_106142 [Pseudobutyrivibrio sp. UC1225]|uniref:hypothetical protein n=1 Tax=Pseudobutyrivibrio sp. UC1225 TaxID=1798185 RepID=UPI0008E59731|nr:hypothetical protein [Pseudobutyrivibrio sp. UC1225]SFO03852.1 hypothetical protein SAMN04487831_106142 [Pseudobutyrivibrio sp. UC1225]